MKCDYCGEFEAFMEVPNPNIDFGKMTYWKVCGWCAQIIPLQQKMTLHSMMKFLCSDKPEIVKYADQEIQKITKEIKNIELKSGMATFTATLSKKEGLK